MVEPSQEQLKEMKRRELDLLKAFVGICETYKLRYYLLGGTLLGAVRHQGFIPWDDDIDVGMPRADYEVFLREAQANLPEYYFLQDLHTEPDYALNFAKLRDSRTTFVEYSCRKFHINHGLYIDIFPLDNYPDSEKDRKTLDMQQQIFKYRIRAAMEVPQEAQHSPFLEFGLNAVAGLTTLLYPDYRKAVEKREKLHCSIPAGEKWANYCGAWGKKEIMPKAWYGDGVKLSFEGMELMCPAEYEKWLTQVYGNFMQLPPVEKRVGHHFAEAIDLDSPYTEYLNQINQKK